MENLPGAVTEIVSALVSSEIASSYADEVLLSMPIENSSDHLSTYHSICELNKLGKLGGFIRSKNSHPCTMDFSYYVLECLNKKYDSDFEIFPVISLRMITDTCVTNRLSWHQDEATWYRDSNLRGKNPITIWLPLISWGEDPSRLEVFRSAANRLGWHKKSAVGYFDADQEFSTLGAVEQTVFSSLSVGDATIFGPLTPHRSTAGSGRYYRVSLDVRAYLKSSAFSGYRRSWKFFFV